MVKTPRPLKYIDKAAKDGKYTTKEIKKIEQLADTVDNEAKDLQNKCDKVTNMADKLTDKIKKQTD